jgi:hypothetical protein
MVEREDDDLKLKGCAMDRTYLRRACALEARAADYAIPDCGLRC